ncbi:MAG: hypothetical protein J6L23_04690 [Clostridia bacterium]|nr:hypothetical protein [Clostridia bacterium]
MKKILVILFALILTLGLMVSCGNGDTNTESSTSSTENGGNEMNSVSTHVVKLVPDLKGFKDAKDGDIVIVKGYHSLNDAGAGRFVYYSEYEGEADGGTVIEANDGGKFVRVCSPTERHVAWFGAKAGDQGDDLAAIKAAINSLKNGGTVHFSGGKYMISETLTIDSSSNNVKLVGKGGWNSTAIHASTALDTMVHVKGVDGLTIDGILFYGELKTKNTIILESITNSVIKNSRVFQFTEYGFKLIAGELGPSTNNTFDQLNAITTHAENPIYCFYIGGDQATGNVVENCTFSTCRFDHHQTPNSVSVTLAYAQKISFYRCHFAGYSDQSKGLCLDALNNNGYPKAINIYDCSVNNVLIKEDGDGKIGNIMMFGHGTYDNEEIPVHDNIRVITDEGTLAGYLVGGGASGLPKKTANFETNTNGEFVHHNMKAGTKSIGIRFNNGGTFTGGTVRLATYGGGTGCQLKLSVYKWDTDFDTTIKGEELRTCILKDFADNSMVDFEFDEPLEAGEYLVLLHEGKADGYGVAVWTKNAGQGIKTYKDGKEASLGVVGMFYVE